VNESKLLMRKGMTGATGNWYCGLDEVDDMGFVLHTLRPGELFVDVGANIGSYSILAASGVGTRVIAIEPIPSTFSILKQNIRLNGLEGQVVARHLGLSNNASELRFTTTQDTTNHVLGDSEKAQGETIDVTTLDNLLEGEAIPAVIKIDVEGYEFAVLKGAKRTLSSPGLLAVIMETNSSGIRYGISDQQLMDIMEEHGFEMWNYRAIERELKPLRHVDNKADNTIFLRNHKEIEQRVKSAPNTKLINGWI